MKKLKKMMVGVVLTVTLLGNCLTVAAFDSSFDCSGCGNELQSDEIYECNSVYRQLYRTYPVQDGSSYIICKEYKHYYRVRYRCGQCGIENLCNEYTIEYEYTR